jgi:hypothetical protein
VARGDDKPPRKPGARTLPPGKARPGLPDPEEIVAEHSFVSPKGKRYRVLRTNERDAYEEDDGPERKDE